LGVTSTIKAKFTVYYIRNKKCVRRRGREGEGEKEGGEGEGEKERERRREGEGEKERERGSRERGRGHTARIRGNGAATIKRVVAGLDQATRWEVRSDGNVAVDADVFDVVDRLSTVTIISAF
jgi:hypothetical protein